ncbi:spore germination protein [Filobacillus milosensis]|uniref:spore germination protein n=1 Tax=Filobacillus milosensis TaxID=94137 RepID=UPI001890C02B|nr:spore germination protein [Filobacillus milosensis]
MLFKKILKSFNEKQQPKQESIKISSSLTKNIELVKELLNNADDLKIRVLDNGEACLVYIESLVLSEKIQQNIFQPLYHKEVSNYSNLDYGNQLTLIDDIGKFLLKGHAVILQNNKNYGLSFNVLNTKLRNVQEPMNELVIRGSHDGFIEDISTNINLIRKRIENYNLVVKYYSKGSQTNNKIAVVYLKGIASDDNVKEIERRIETIDSDMIISPGYIEEFVEDTPMSPFPQILSTERPDRTIANILEGRIAIFSEGSPSCLIAPVSFFAFYQSPDDYNSRWISGTFLRLVRLTSFLIAIGLPSVYIAIIGFHFEVIPHDLIIPVKASINEIPYPPIIEALMMVIVIELIREAGIRLRTYWSDNRYCWWFSYW